MARVAQSNCHALRQEGDHPLGFIGREVNPEAAIEVERDETTVCPWRRRKERHYMAVHDHIMVLERPG
jgi:hypothetical protein